MKKILISGVGLTILSLALSAGYAKTVVTVVEGEVQFSNKEGSVLARAGEELEVSPGLAPRKPVIFDPWKTNLWAKEEHSEILRGRIVGKVISFKGGSVTGAKILAEPYAEGGARADAVTLEGGVYELEGLPVGIYDVIVKAKGFKATYRKHVRVFGGKDTWVNFTLKPGEWKEEGKKYKPHKEEDKKHKLHENEASNEELLEKVKKYDRLVKEALDKGEREKAHHYMKKAEEYEKILRRRKEGKKHREKDDKEELLDKVKEYDRLAQEALKKGDRKKARHYMEMAEKYEKVLRERLREE